MHVACQKSCLFAGRAAQDSTVPDEVAASFRKQGRCDFVCTTCPNPVIKLPNRARAVVRPFCRIAVNTIVGSAGPRLEEVPSRSRLRYSSCCSADFLGHLPEVP